MKQEIRKMCYGAMCLSLCIVLPLAFHFVANAGGIFLPMHLPVLLAGFICGPVYGLFIGVFGPLLSSLMTGMPPSPVLPGMMCELGTYGLFSGLLIRLLPIKKEGVRIYISLLVSMLLGRCVAGLVNMYVTQSKNYSWAYWASAEFVTCLPGIVIQLSIIPLIVYALEKIHVLDISSETPWAFLDSLYRRKKSEAFFNAAAEGWDKNQTISAEEVDRLLSQVEFTPGEKILDVACGTGIIDDYLLSHSALVDGIDLSPEMIKRAKEKFIGRAGIRFFCGDFITFKLEKYDAIIVFNAYPHFIDRVDFASKAAECLKDGGRLYIIHSASKEEINSRHEKSKAVRQVSSELLPASEEAKYYEHRFLVQKTIDNDKMYLIYAVKKER
jgi:cyclopropane fatty-acyl-phospholipid synthase-like methyltransferase/uncharacterized membrane protein